MKMKAEQGDDSTNQGTPKLAIKPPESRKKAQTESSFTASEGANPAHTLILDLWPLEL
jgi:hypothetical protein